MTLPTFDLDRNVPRCQWQVFVAFDSSEGGILVPVQPYEPTGFWLDITATEAALGATNKEWIRLH